MRLIVVQNAKYENSLNIFHSVQSQILSSGLLALFYPKQERMFMDRLVFPVDCRD